MKKNVAAQTTKEKRCLFLINFYIEAVKERSLTLATNPILLHIGTG